MVGMINWLKGYLRIRVKGEAVERFMNLCGYKNILLWDVQRKGDVLELFISLNAFRSLRPIVRKTQVKVVILEKIGLPFFVANMNQRKIFLAGTVFVLLFWQISGNFIWNIQIAGNYRITTEQISDYLDANGIHVGMWKKRIQIESLEKALRITFPEIIWTSGKLEGTTFVLDIKEAEGIMETTTSEDGIQYDIVAPFDGEIYSIVVRKGVPKVKQGDMVTKDTLLVEGMVPIMNDDGTIRENIYTKSDADIYIMHTIDFQEVLPLFYIRKEYTGRTKQFPYVRIGDKELTLGSSQSYLISDTIIQESTWKLCKEAKIPISWGTYTSREYLNQETLYTQEEAKHILEEKLINFLATLSEKGVQILEKDVKIVKKDDGWILQGKIQLAEPVRDVKRVEQGMIEALENS